MVCSFRVSPELAPTPCRNLTQFTRFAFALAAACVFGGTLVWSPSHASACSGGLPAYHRVQFQGHEVLALTEASGSGLRLGAAGAHRFQVSNLTRRTNRFLSADGEQIAVFKENYAEDPVDCLPLNVSIEVRSVRNDRQLASFQLEVNEVHRAWFALENSRLVIQGFRSSTQSDEVYVVNLQDGSMTTLSAFRAGVTSDDHLVTLDEEGLALRSLRDLNAVERIMSSDELDGIYQLLPGANHTRDQITLFRDEGSISLLTVVRTATGFETHRNELSTSGRVVSSDASAEYLVVMDREAGAVRVIDRSGRIRIEVTGQPVYTAAAIAPDASALAVVSVTEPDAEVFPTSYAFEQSATELIFPSGRVIGRGRAQRSRVRRVTRPTSG